MMSAAATAATATADLQLLPGGSSQNKLSLKISATVEYNGSPISVSDTRTTECSGILKTEIEMDASGKPTSLTILQGSSLSFTDMKFNFKAYGLLSVGILETSALTGTAFTTTPPTLLDAAGIFDAETQTFRIDHGEGTLTSGLLGDPVTISFSEDPFEGIGSGTGTIVLEQKGETDTETIHTAIISLPVALDQLQDFDENQVRLQMSGNVVATGEIRLAKITEPQVPTYHEWAAANGNPPFDSTNAYGIPNGVAWALGEPSSSTIHLPTGLGIARDTDPAPLLGPIFILKLAAEGSRAPILIRSSSDLGPIWPPIPSAMLSGGANPVPTGTRGEVSIQLPIGQNFLRLEVAQP